MPEHFFSGTSNSALEKHRSSVTRPLFIPSQSTLVPSGIHFTEENIRKLEIVQSRAARMSKTTRAALVCTMLTLDLPVASHLCCSSSSGLPYRNAEPRQLKATMRYRIVYNLVDIPVNRLTPTISVRGHNMRFLVPFARTLIYQRSFFPDTIRIWNSLPQTVACCPSIDRFRREVQTIRLR